MRATQTDLDRAGHVGERTDRYHPGASSLPSVQTVLRRCSDPDPSYPVCVTSQAAGMTLLVSRPHTGQMHEGKQQKCYEELVNDMRVGFSLSSVALPAVFIPAVG